MTDVNTDTEIYDVIFRRKLFQYQQKTNNVQLYMFYIRIKSKFYSYIKYIFMCYIK